MSIVHRFGGGWTEDKLSRLESYLVEYRRIFTRNARARFFRTWYVDAFAGTGYRSVPKADQLELDLFRDVYEDDESNKYLDGSARIALGLENPFDRYLFVEKSKTKCAELRLTVERDFKSVYHTCEFVAEDANSALRSWCDSRDWSKERAVVFLDPYGMQVDWSTVEMLGRTQAVDLWYLFPLGIGVSRLLPRSGVVDPGWRKRLNRVFGTSDWEERFYDVQRQGSFPFEEGEKVSRIADEHRIEAFIAERLESTFVGVAKGLILMNSRSSPLYMLCFASANPKGAQTAVRIAQHILRKPKKPKDGG